MTYLVLISPVLLTIYCAGVCASEDNDLVVLTTASRLREEIRSQLNEAGLCKCEQLNYTSLHEDHERVTESVKEVISSTVEDLLQTHLSHLVTPG